MYTYWIFSQTRISKYFCCQEIDLKTKSTHWKVKISRRPNIGLWGVYPQANCLTQWPAMLADCTQILIWVSVSWDKAPNGLFWKFTIKIGSRGFISRYAHPNKNLSTIRQHCRPLPLDRQPRCLCLVDVKFSLFNGKVPFWGQFPESKKLWKPFLG